MRNLSISVYFARAVLHNAVKHGLDPRQLLLGNRISPRLLQEENARISIERFADLQVATMRAMGDEALGYANRRLPIGTWDMMCHAVIGSATLGQAISRYCRFYQMFDLDLNPAVEVNDSTATIRLDHTASHGKPPPYLAELLLFNTHRFASWLVQEHLPIQLVRLSYPMAAKASDYRHMFLANPVTFEQPDCALVLSGTMMERPVTQTEQSLHHFIRHPALIMLTQNYASSSWTTRVRDMIGKNMRTIPEFSEVAANLDLHPQTLRRRLSAEGVTFTEIKNHLKRDTALYYLGKQGLTIEEIAYRSGFSEAAAFIRAFKSWTGVTPYSYRKGL